MYQNEDGTWLANNRARYSAIPPASVIASTASGFYAPLEVHAVIRAALLFGAPVGCLVFFVMDKFDKVDADQALYFNTLSSANRSKELKDIAIKGIERLKEKILAKPESEKKNRALEILANEKTTLTEEVLCKKVIHYMKSNFPKGELPLDRAKNSYSAFLTDKDVRWYYLHALERRIEDFIEKESFAERLQVRRLKARLASQVR